ncbi:MAG: glycosyltransferase family 2 protein [Thermoplasmata archaeon]|nr:MAG: glycosyltransferase family 2 protein [Thermoplasmata archaeon]
MGIEAIILFILVGYLSLGFLQIICALKMKKSANNMRFSEKDFSVSVIIPVKGVSRSTKKNLESVCIQDYPNFEVIFVAERKEHPAFRIANNLSKKYQNVKVLLSGPHDSSKTIGKCHNLIFGVKHAKGEVLLFGDSDVTYSRDWIFKMSSPLKEVIDGKRIEAVTAPFFIEPEGILGKLIAQSVSLVTFTASFTNKNQMFPPFASGASIAITRKLFYDLEIVEVWSSSFNDDLVLAYVLKSHGYNIYNQLAHLNHTNEVFTDFRQTKEKLIRWVVTISSFGHRDLKRNTYFMVARNLQFPVSLVLGLVLFLIGFSGVFVLILISAGYSYSVAYRWAVGIIIEEEGMTPYYLLAPVMGLAMMVFYVSVRLSKRSFSWEGRTYHV